MSHAIVVYYNVIRLFARSLQYMDDTLPRCLQLSSTEFE